MRDRNRILYEIRCDITKCIRFDEYTYGVIASYRGRNFSDKIRNYVFDHEKNKTDNQE